MRRKVLKFLMTTLALTLLAGCGKQAERVDSENVVLEEETQETQEEEVVEPEQVEEPVVEPEPEPEPEPIDFLEAHDITITPQGDCKVTLWAGEQDGVTFVSDYDAPVNVVISETTEGTDEGFKKVSALFTLDAFSNCPSDFIKFQTLTFDRYTGTSFEFDSNSTTYFSGDHETKEGYVTIQNGDEYYDVSMEQSVDFQNPIAYITLTVTCPVDYNGTVFCIGYITPELGEQYDQMDLSARLYTIDELPFYGEKYLYFTMSNE